MAVEPRYRRVILYDSNNNPIDEDSPVYIHSSGEIDINNSTTTPLTAGSVFTGTSTEVLHEAMIIISLKSDQASATDGLSVQQSTDGTNWDHTDEFTIPAATGKTFSFQPAARYLRVVYTNGGTNQTYFRLQTILKATYVKPSSHRIQDSISTDDDAELIKAVITGENGGGSFKNVKVTTDGNLAISDNSSGLSIAEGLVTGASFIHKFGSAPDFDVTDGFVTIWDGAEDNTTWEKMVYNYSTTADIEYISSDNAGDTEDIEVQGLDANYDLVVQTKTLTGQTSAQLDTPLIRVFRLKNVGSTDLVGHVFCSTTAAPAGGVPTTANIRAIIQPGNNQTEMAVFTIPNGKTGYMRDWYASTAGAKRDSQHTIKLFARPFGQVFQLKHNSNISVTGTSYIQHKYEEPEVFSAKTDIEMTCDTDTDIAGVSGGFDIVLIDN